MDTQLRLFDLEIGTVLPEIKKNVIQEEINLYAEASGDFNPIHIDLEFAKATPLGGTIAHGMLILAYISQMLTLAFGMNWLTAGKLNVRFKTPARPGDTITVTGKVLKVENGDVLVTVTCNILCQNQNSETIIMGDAMVKIKGSN